MIDSSAENFAENDVELEDSDNNVIDQSNEQEIEDVKKDSHAENDAENSATFE